VRAVDPQDHARFHALYRARVTNGMLDRSTAIWERVSDPRSEHAVFAELLGPENAPEGYLVYAQPLGYGPHDYDVRDWCALTPAAAHRLLAFFADHRSLGKDLRWNGPATEPILGLLPEQGAKASRILRWHLRIVHLQRALELRGYAPGAEGELHLEVIDAQLPENAGRFMLRVEGGRATVRPGGRGELYCDIRGLAPLYSGFLTPRALRSLGWISGHDAAIDDATRLFAGPEPWMPDLF
jgi:predicted acetyltransferase